MKKFILVIWVLLIFGFYKVLEHSKPKPNIVYEVGKCLKVDTGYNKGLVFLITGINEKQGTMSVIGTDRKEYFLIRNNSEIASHFEEKYRKTIEVNVKNVDCNGYFKMEIKEN